MGNSRIKMLVCTLGSKQRKRTLRYAAEVAKALEADTTFLGVADKRRKMADLERVLQAAAEDLAAQGLPVHVLVETGRAEGIVMAEIARTSYDLVAVGALGQRRSRQAFFDSVGMRIVERAESSVLLIKGDYRELSRLLICASGAQVGQVAIQAGASLTCGAGAQATVLHVVDAMPAMYTGLEQMEETLAELLQSESDSSRQLKWAARTVNKECKLSNLKLRRGIVADEILREGREGNYDLIVLGSSRAANGFVRILMGDLTREILGRAHRPVLVVCPSNGDTQDP
jgi:nucleotide-binding universal stress UspA family protein